MSDPKKVLAWLVATLAACSLSMLAAPAAQAAGIGWVPVRLADGQGLRLGLSNLVDVDDPRNPPGACRGTVSFYDERGRLVSAESAFELEPGVSLHVASAAPKAASRRAVVRFARVPAPDRAGIAAADPCRAVFAGAEVFDLQTGRTAFMNPGVIRGFDPQPEPPMFGFAE